MRLALVDSIIKYAASTQLEGDAWKDLVETVQQSGLTSIVAFDAAAKEAEASFRKQSDKNMPNAWRSAKSIVRSAIKASVSLVDAGGKPLGKTAVVKAISALRPTKAPRVCPHCGGPL